MYRFVVIVHCADQMTVEQQQAPAAAEEAPPPPQQQQQQQRQQGEQPSAGADKPSTASPAPEQLEGLVGMLGLDSAQDELQQWLQEEAAAAEERQRRRASAGVDSGGESTDAGLSEGESDWGFTSGGETTGDEGTDVDDYDGYNEDV